MKWTARELLCGVLVALPASAPLAAHACKLHEARVINGITATVPNELSPDVILYPFRGTGSTSLKECANDVSFPITLTPTMAGLTYVRNVHIDGASYPAYGWHATSPLIAFKYRLANNWGEVSSGPLDMARPTSVAGWSNGYLFMSVQMAIIYRGGSMTSVGRVSMGSVGTTFSKFPTLQLSNGLAGDVNMQNETCYIFPPPVTLRDVTVADLASPGQSAAEVDVEVELLCEALGFVDLSISDASDPGNRTDQLAPTPDSQATGVHTQILLNDVPLVMGTQWAFGPVQNGGSYLLPFKARYIRTVDTIGPGIIKGQAVLSATYR